MTIARIKGIVDLLSTLLGIAWVILALQVLALPWWLFAAITVLIAFGAGWLRYDLRCRAARRGVPWG